MVNVMTVEKVKYYLDGVFAPYVELQQMRELKEELLQDLRDKYADMRKEGYDEEKAYEKTIDSIGEISDLIEGMNASTRRLHQIIGMDFSKSNLQNTDFTSISVHDGKFNYSNLQGSNFSHSDLTNSSFKCSNLDNAIFQNVNLTGALMSKSNLRGATFQNCVFDNVQFKWSDLSGICFDNQTFNGANFDYSSLKKTSFRNATFKHCSFKSEVKKAIFDGATMDKLTYLLLKAYNADLGRVIVI
jgi:uncharacterized protein YjbI with pentapeptide repeats